MDFKIWLKSKQEKDGIQSAHTSRDEWMIDYSELVFRLITWVREIQETGIFVRLIKKDKEIREYILNREEYTLPWLVIKFPNVGEVHFDPIGVFVVGGLGQVYVNVLPIQGRASAFRLERYFTEDSMRCSWRMICEVDSNKIGVDFNLPNLEAELLQRFESEMGSIA